jgi:hypothetical protein
MSLTVGQQALIRRIVTMTTSANIVLPNGPGAGLPRYVVQVSGGSQIRRTVDGTTEARPEIVVRVETKDGEYANENDTLVAALVARFPCNASFDGVTIIDAPLPRAPLPLADGVYSVPVIIRGFTSF